MTAILEPPTVSPPAPAPAPAPAAVAPAPVAPPTPPAARTRPVPPPAVPRPPRVRPVLTPTGVRLVGAGLVALFVIGLLVEPSPNGPEPVLSAAEQLVSTVLSMLMVAGLAGFTIGRRWALPTGLAFSGLLAVNVALCPLTGHHLIGWWWYAQVGIVAAMVALPALVLARTRAG